MLPIVIIIGLVIESPELKGATTAYAQNVIPQTFVNTSRVARIDSIPAKLSPGYVIVDIVFSPDGKKLLFIAEDQNAGEHSKVFMINHDGSQLRQISDPRRYVFTCGWQENDKVWLTSAVITQGRNGDRWFAKGETVLYDLTGTRITQLEDFNGHLEASQYLFRPSPREAVYFDPHTLALRTMSGVPLKLFTFPVDSPTVRFVSWSLSGDSLLFGIGSPQGQNFCYMTSLLLGKTTLLFPYVDQYLTAYFAPDSKQIYYRHFSSVMAFHLADSNTELIYRLATTESDSSAKLDKRFRWTIPIKSGKSKTTSPLADHTYFRAFAQSRDQKQLAVSCKEGILILTLK